MNQPCAKPPQSLTLRASLDAISREAIGVIAAGLGVGVLAIIAFFMLAQFRYLLYPLALPTRSDEVILAIAMLLLFWAIAFGCLSHLRQRLQSALAYRLAHRLALPAIVATADLRGLSSGEVAQTLNAVEEVTECVQGPLITAALDCAIAPLLILLLATAHWSLLILTLVSGLVQALAAYVTRVLVMPALLAANATQNRAIVAMGDAINAAEVVEAMGFLPALTRRWGSDVHGGVAEMARVQRASRLMEAVSGYISVLLSVGPIMMMTVLAITNTNMGLDGSLSLVALLIMPAVIGPFTRITGLMTEMSVALRAWSVLTDLAKREQNKPHAVFQCAEGVVTVDSLTVLLPLMQQPILRELSFRVAPGQVIALSGPVGSGKSTLLRAIIGIQQPTSGGCYLDGHATWQWDRQDFARHVGYLAQEIGIADGTVADVIARLGAPDMGQVLEAARRAGAHDFIVDLPNGYYTRLTEHALSAGQRQRIGIARAIYGRPRVLVLDEPGSWLDAAGLRQLRRLLTLMRREGVAVIFSSHEPGLLDEADHTVTFGQIGERPRATSRAATPALAGPVDA